MYKSSPTPLLPPNATALERRLDAQTQRVDALPVTFARLIDPFTCPAPFLPWLAWSRRVEYWDGSWSDAHKRQIVAAARSFNAQRGTRSTLAQAMENLGLGHTLTAWHQLSPKGEPFTFTVGITSGRVSVQQQQEIYTALDSVKSARDQFSIDAQVVNTATIFAAGVCRTGITARISTKTN